jgi:hypothetical protein
MTQPTIEIPLFLHREMTSVECLDISQRLTTELKDSQTGLPSEDWLNRAIVDEVCTLELELAERMRIEKSSRFTKDKQRAHEQRRRYLVGIRASARQWVRNPDPATPEEMRTSGETLLDVFTKHKFSIRSKGQVETSGVVRLLLEEFATEELQAALKKLDLLRLHSLLEESHQRYQAIVRQDEGAEAKEKIQKDEATQELASASQTGPRRLREIKVAMANGLSLAFENMEFLARTGRKPYELLLARCCQITNALIPIIKLRDTLEKKAEAKKAAQAESGNAATTATSKPEETAAESTPPRSGLGAAPAPSVAASGEGLAG